MRIHAEQNCDGCTQRRDLREGEVDEDHTALDDVYAKVRMNASENQAGDKGKNEKLQYFHGFYFVESNACLSRFKS